MPAELVGEVSGGPGPGRWPEARHDKARRGKAADGLLRHIDHEKPAAARPGGRNTPHSIFGNSLGRSSLNGKCYRVAACGLSWGAAAETGRCASDESRTRKTRRGVRRAGADPHTRISVRSDVNGGSVPV